MKALLLDRSGLADALSGKRAKSSGTAMSLQEIVNYEMRNEEVLAIWSGPKLDKHPVCIVVNDSETQDWLAWVITFAPTLCPFTAFCHVVEQSEFRMLMSKAARKTLPIGLLGLVLGEIITAEGPHAKPSSPPHAVAIYATALSYSLARASALSPGVDFQLISKRWKRARQITEQRSRAILPDQIVQACHILLDASNGDSVPSRVNDVASVAVRVCSALGTRGASAALSALPANKSWYANGLDEMSGTREARVSAFERAVERLRKQSSGLDSMNDFVVGFLASLVAPGSLAHAPLVARNLDICPMSVVWYAACASLGDRRRFLSENGGIGRRILRELERGWELISPPDCDISLPELEVYLTTKKQNRSFLVSVPSFLSIELSPGVQTIVGWQSVPERGLRLPEADLRERQFVAQEVRRMSERLKHLALRLGEDTVSPSGQQQMLFESDYSQPARKRKPRTKGR